MKDIPEQILVDISNLEINDTIKIGGLSVDNIQFLENPNKIVASVLTTRNVENAEGGEIA